MSQNKNNTKETTADKSITPPSVLGIQGSIAPTQFAMYSFKATDVKTQDELSLNEYLDEKVYPNFDKQCEPLIIGERQKLNTTNKSYGSSTDKASKNLNENPVILVDTETAYLPLDASMLVLKGSVMFSASALELHSCNNPEFNVKYKEYIQALKNKGMFLALAEKYVMNLVNGAILWRNKGINFSVRLQSVSYNTKKDEVLNNITVSAQDINFINKNKLSVKETINNDIIADQLNVLIKQVAIALSEPNAELKVKVTTISEMAEGAQVYPSQLFASDNDKCKRYNFSYIFKNGERVKQAIITSQKIGNAIRIIDESYKNVNEGILEAISVNPNGISKKEGVAYRHCIGKSFWDYFVEGKAKSNIKGLIDEVSSHNLTKDMQEKHQFMLACFILGGIYSVSKD